MRTSPELTDVQIAVASSHIRKMDRVVRRLTEIGMLLDRIDRETGVVVGRIDPLRFELLKRVPGVGASERYGEVRVSTQRGPNR